MIRHAYTIAYSLSVCNRKFQIESRQKDSSGCILKVQIKKGRQIAVKGYFVSEGYMGYVAGIWRLFADERDYLDYMRD